MQGALDIHEPLEEKIIFKMAQETGSSPDCIACMQTVVRRSLRSIMPDAAKVFENLFKPLEIQEPAFKNVVVLYRRKVPDKPQRKSEYEPIRKHNVVGRSD